MFVEFCITFIKIILFNSCSSLAFLKMKGQKVENYTKKTIATILNIIIALGYAALYNIASLQKYNVPIANFICYLIYMASFSIIINNNVMNNITPIAISITISYINLFLTTMISFLVLKVLTLDITKNTIIEYFIIGLFQVLLAYLFFKIKRFKNGFAFLKNDKLNRKVTSIIISVIILSISIILGLHYNAWIETFLIIGIAVGGILMLYWIKKSITKYYKEKMKERTVEIQQEQIKQQDEKIKDLQTELADVLQINHKYSHRISAMEKAVTKLGTKLQANEEFAEEYGDILSSIKKLSKEYKEEVASVIKETKLPKTNIFSTDNLLEYMKQEAEKDKISFELKIDFDINEILETKIPQNKLETMLADHIRDAIIAINCSENKDRRIKVVLDKEDNNYQIKFYDTGREFEIETLSKLGLKRTTTHKATGGSGIGFMTTFETLKQCKASLIIEEYSNQEYTKAVIIKFDNKNEYRIHSYRAEEIKNKIKDNRTIIE